MYLVKEGACLSEPGLLMYSETSVVKTTQLLMLRSIIFLKKKVERLPSYPFNMDELALCNICTEEFDDDPSIRPSDGMSSHLPIQSARCSHTSSICYSCIMKIKMNKAVEENKDPCKIKWLGCPDCRKMTCFNTEDLIVDIGRCKMLRLLRNKSDSSSNNTSTSAPPVGGGESAASVDILQTSNDNQLRQNNDSTETREEVVANSISSSITTRSASRQKRGASNQLSIEENTEMRVARSLESLWMVHLLENVLEGLIKK